jgi:hypothetical protein
VKSFVRQLYKVTVISFCFAVQRKFGLKISDKKEQDVTGKGGE